MQMREIPGAFRPHPLHSARRQHAGLPTAAFAASMMFVPGTNAGSPEVDGLDSLVD
jgi:hypothetical protein